MNNSSVETILSKVEQVIDLLNHTRNQRDELLKETARLSEQVDVLKKEKKTLEDTNSQFQAELNKKQNLPESEAKQQVKQKEIKGKIRELAAEIDKCIALLNQEK